MDQPLSLEQVSQAKLARWNRELKPALLERQDNVRRAKNTSWTLSILSGLGAVLSAFRLRGTPTLTNTVVVCAVGAAVVAGLFARSLGKKTTFENDPKWKLEQFQQAAKAVFDPATGLMIMGLTAARDKYGAAVEDQDWRRWIESDLTKRDLQALNNELVAQDLPDFHGNALLNRALVTDAASVKLVAMFNTMAMSHQCTASASELSNKWNAILAAHGVPEAERKLLFTVPAYHQALDQGNYEILHSRGSLLNLWPSLDVAQRGQLKALFVATAQTRLPSISALCTTYKTELETFGLIIQLPPLDLYALEQVQYRQSPVAERVWSPEGLDLVWTILNTAVSKAESYEAVRQQQFVAGDGRQLGGFENRDLLGHAEWPRLRALFLDQPFRLTCKYAEDMVPDRLMVSVEERDDRLNFDFVQDPLAAHQKHGLRPLTDESVGIAADTRSQAGLRLAGMHRGMSAAQKKELQPLINELGVEQLIREQQKQKWANQSLFAMEDAEETKAFLEMFGNIAVGDQHRAFWTDKAWKQAQGLSFEVLWTQHRAYFNAGLLDTRDFSAKFLEEIQGKSFETVVEIFGVEWFADRFGLVKTSDVQVRRAVGKYLLTVMKLPNCLDNLNPTVRALEKHGFFIQPLRVTIANAAKDMNAAAQRRDQQKEGFARNRAQLCSQAELRHKNYVQPFEMRKDDTARMLGDRRLRVACAANAIRSWEQLPQLNASRPALAQALAKAQAEHDALKSNAPKGDAKQLQQTLAAHQEALKTQDAVASLAAQVEATKQLIEPAQKAAAERRQQLLTNDTFAARWATGLAGGSAEDIRLSELTQQLAKVEKALGEHRAQQTATKGNIQAEGKIQQITAALKVHTDYHGALREKAAQLSRAQDELRKLDGAIGECEQTRDRAFTVFGQCNIREMQRLLIEERAGEQKAQTAAALAEAQHGKAQAESLRERDAEISRADRQMEDSQRRAESDYALAAKEQQDRVDHAIIKAYGLD